MIERIVQESIRLILNTIYEPLFQRTELNFGFRPKRSTSDAIKKISSESQGINIAIQGDITGAYDNVNKKTLIKLLKRKISDKKLLRLIEDSLHTGTILNNKITHSITGVPQDGIASPIYFNIYMHQFDRALMNDLKNSSLIKIPQKTERQQPHPRPRKRLDPLSVN